MSLLFNLLGVQNALADTVQTTTAAGASPHQGGLLSLLPMFVIFIVVFYFLLIRPQTKRAKETKQLLSSVAVGDEVVTAGGIVGRIVKLTETFIVLQVAKGVEITVQKASISAVLPKGTLELAE